MEPIILASSSPRRQEILKSINVPFKTMFPEVEEVLPNDINPHDAPEFFACQKVKAVTKMFPQEQTLPWILGADTAIILDDKLYGKPQTKEEAESFIRSFSGRTHTVVTALALFNGKLNFLDTKVSSNSVTFKTLSDQEIEWYLNTFEWHGVAGGYRIQGLAQLFITDIKGSFSSIMGLPISDFYEIMTTHDYSFLE